MSTKTYKVGRSKCRESMFLVRKYRVSLPGVTWRNDQDRSAENCHNVLQVINTPHEQAQIILAVERA